jgi:hypothetical protein
MIKIGWILLINTITEHFLGNHWSPWRFAIVLIVIGALERMGKISFVE